MQRANKFNQLVWSTVVGEGDGRRRCHCCGCVCVSVCSRVFTEGALCVSDNYLSQFTARIFNMRFAICICTVRVCVYMDVCVCVCGQLHRQHRQELSARERQSQARVERRQRAGDRKIEKGGEGESGRGMSRECEDGRSRGLRKSEISIRPGIAIIDFHVFFCLLPFTFCQLPLPVAARRHLPFPVCAKPIKQLLTCLSTVRMVQ